MRSHKYALISLAGLLTRRTRKSWQSSIILLVACVLMVGCSDTGGGGIVGTGKTLPPAESDGVTIGILDAFGSVVINDRRFETDNATFFFNEEVADITDFRVGMNVSATVNFSSLEAQEVRYTPILVGAISDYDRDHSEITVLGQVIQLTESTVLDEITRDALVQGAIVEVNGARSGNGDILAHYIRLAPSPEISENPASVGGIVTDVFVDDSVALISGTPVSYVEMVENSGLSPTEFVDSFLPVGSVVNALIAVQSDGPASQECTLVAQTTYGTFSTTVNEADDSESNGQNNQSDPLTTVGTDGSLTVPNLTIYPDGSIQLVIDGGERGPTNVNATPDGVSITTNCLIAKSITAVDLSPVGSGDIVELSGIVSGIADNGKFFVHGLAVEKNQSTSVFSAFDVELSEYQISRGDRVLVRGDVLENSEILAREIYLDRH
jgi:hypothetical protein